MARKGWEALSDAYRRRLKAGGVSQSAYESGTSLHKARGHVSQSDESFRKQARRFVERYRTGDRPHVSGAEIRAMDSRELAHRIVAMGPEQGRAYMDNRRQMTRLYERGDFEDAKRLYQMRPASSPAHMWWYHGIFGG